MFPRGCVYLLCCLAITFNQSSVGLCRFPFLATSLHFLYALCVSFSHLKCFTLVFYYKVLETCRKNLKISMCNRFLGTCHPHGPNVIILTSRSLFLKADLVNYSHLQHFSPFCLPRISAALKSSSSHMDFLPTKERQAALAFSKVDISGAESRH